MKPIFRFGLPLGSSLILLGLLELLKPLMGLTLDLVSWLAIKELDHHQEMGAYEWIWIALVITEIAVSGILLCYGVIVKGDKRALIYWLGCSATFIGFFIIIQLLIVDWSTVDWTVKLNAVYLIFMSLILFGYELNLGVQCLPDFATISNLEPIGKGLQFVYDYYKLHAKEAAEVVLMFEIIFNAEIFLDRQVTRFVFSYEFVGHENETNLAIITEETLLRYVRMGVAMAGFFLAYKEKKYWMFRWCLCYLMINAVSGGILCYLMITWRAEHTILTLLYFGISTINLLYRTFVLYVCVLYTDTFERRGIPM